MQNAATMADGTLITVLCLCQGDRYQNWIVPPLNFSMCEFVSSSFPTMPIQKTCSSIV